MEHDVERPDESSVTHWLNGLKAGEPEAATQIWNRYVEQLIREAERQLQRLPRRVVGGEDIAQEAFAAFFRGVELRRFSQLEDRHDLWQILVMLADRRAKDFIRRHLGQVRGQGQVRGDSVLQTGPEHPGSATAGFDTLAAPPIGPESAESLIRLIDHCFPELNDDGLRRIALDRAANYTVAEIAQRHSISQRSAERKLELICRIVKQSALQQ
ncbi:MAG: hypothetical protein JSS02_10470 [Planctomycetes bacterium]|nr:hypothetical protein [Planctomycetota bacterium]